MKISNMFIINLVKNTIARGRSKHIKMRYYYLREQVENGRVSLEHCRSENQIVDIMTKVVQVKLFKRLITMMNVDNLDTMNYVTC